jgi:hypothetical protein
VEECHMTLERGKGDGKMRHWSIGQVPVKQEEKVLVFFITIVQSVIKYCIFQNS